MNAVARIAARAVAPRVAAPRASDLFLSPSARRAAAAGEPVPALTPTSPPAGDESPSPLRRLVDVVVARTEHAVGRRRVVEGHESEPEDREPAQSRAGGPAPAPGSGGAAPVPPVERHVHTVLELRPAAPAASASAGSIPAAAVAATTVRHRAEPESAPVVVHIGRVELVVPASDPRPPEAVPLPVRIEHPDVLAAHRTYARGGWPA